MTLTERDPADSETHSLIWVIGGSLFLHIFVIFAIPLFSAFFRPAAQHYEAPATFQVVSMPRAKSAPARAAARPKAAPQKVQEAVPAKHPSAKSAPAKIEQKPEEEVDELSDMLNEISTPAAISSATADFSYPWYLGTVQQKIERFWTPPMKKEGVEVVVAFVIKADGTINEPSIATSSGIATLDNLAIRAVTLAAPFGKLPPGYSGNELSVKCSLKPVMK